MGRSKEQLPTLIEIKELLSYLPKLYAEGFSPVKRWDGGKTAFQVPWPEYDPVVTTFYQILALDCWSDYNYQPGQAGKMVADEDVISSANLAQIKTMLTFCTRAEKFSDGAWGAAIENGTIRRLLERLGEIRAEIEGK